MRLEYTLDGLSCPNCGNKIERAVAALGGVASASVNMINGVLTVETESDIYADLKKIVKKIEPDVTVTYSDTVVYKEKKGINFKMMSLILGAALFLTGMIFTFGEKAEFVIFCAAYALLGWEVVLHAVRNILKGQIFDENFLMLIATVGAFIIGETPEAAGVMLFYQIGETVQDAAVEKSKKSISGLMDIRPDFANVESDGGLVRVAPESVSVGDVIVVKPGEKIPLDGKIIGGQSSLDTRALTGESLPRDVGTGDGVFSGSINQGGVLSIRVSKAFSESTASKILDLVENSAGKKAKTENFITTFSKYYTPAVVLIATLLAVIPPLLEGGGWSDWLGRGLVFLVISCPCALVISIPLGYFGGIGGASKRGVLVKGGNYLEALNRLDTVVFDKTGTLTRGAFDVTEIIAEGNKDELLKLTAHAESFSNHPIALSIINAYGKKPELPVTDYRELPGYGVSASVNGKAVLAGNDKLMRLNGISVPDNTGIGTKVFSAVDGIYTGVIIISDRIKPDSGKAVAGLKAAGIKQVIMLTGDGGDIARSVAEELGIDEFHAELLSADKGEKLEEINAGKPKNSKLAFVGDGINDAPVLAMADIGIAMGGLGSDAAIEAADIVIMTDEPSKLIDAVEVAKFTKKIVWQNIIFALGIKGVFLVLGALGAANLWEAVFADVGVALLAILNAMRVIRKK